MQTITDRQTDDIEVSDLTVTDAPQGRQPLSRESIMAAARKILVEEGLDAVSLRKVAGSLGVTAPALYLHVAHKRDLLQGIAEQEFELLLERFHQVDVADPVERVRRLSHLYVEYACENPALFRAMFLFRPELASEPRGDDEALATKAYRYAADSVRQAVEDGRFRNDDADLAALTLWTSVHGVATMLLSGPNLNGSEEKLAASVIDTVIAGLEAA